MIFVFIAGFQEFFICCDMLSQVEETRIDKMWFKTFTSESEPPVRKLRKGRHEFDVYLHFSRFVWTRECLAYECKCW